MLPLPHKFFHYIRHIRNEGISMAHIVVANNLTKAYGSKVVVKNFSLTVHAGEVVALVGDAGVGKSSILKMIAADVKPDEGAVSVGGYDTVLQAGLVRPLIGVIHHEHFLESNLTGRENLEEQAMLRFLTPDESEPRINVLLSHVALGARVDAHVQTYSPDEWLRLELAACLIHQPKLLIIDEPTRDCDDAGCERVWQALRNVRPSVVSVLCATRAEAAVQALQARRLKL